MKRISLVTFLLCGMVSLFAQDNSRAIVASEFHVTRPLRDIFAENPVDESKLEKEGESEDRQHRIPTKFYKTGVDGAEWGNDPASIQNRMGTVPSIPVRASWAGQTASGFRPFDPSGAVGPNHYVQMINSTTFKVYSKTGTVMLTGTLGNLWSPATANNGDPIVMYDKAANRWFLAQFGSSSDRKIFIAISTTADPTGSYYTYTYVSPAFPDYLKFGVWHDGYYMTSNQSTQNVFAFERTAMLAGTPGARAVYVNYSPPKSGFFVPLAGDAADGTLPVAGTPCPIFSYSDNGWGASYFDRVNIYNMAVNWVPTTPTATITLAANISTAAFDGSYNASWNDCSQPGTTQKLDGIGGAMMYRAQWKTWSGYNSVVLSWGVKISSTQRSIKWCELRQSQSTGTWTMYQEGIYSPDANTRWMGTMAMDNNGSIGLSYIKSNATSIYPGLYYTGRRSCDPLGTLPVTETVVIAGTGSQTGGNRVGDYSQTTLDPDGVTFWSTSEFMGGSTGSSAARTRIFSYQITPCTSPTAAVAIALTSGTNPSCAGASKTFTATPTNGGTAPAYQWKVNGTNVGTNSTTYTTTSLTNGQIVTCVMTSNLSGVLGNPATSNAITATINSPVTPAVSIAITSGTNPTTTGASVTFTATPTNGGTTPAYQWKVNGTNVGTNSPTYTTTTLTNGAIVTCVMTSNAACPSPATATSNAITMTIVAGGGGPCDASTTSITYEYISNVNMGSINNTTANSSFSNYTALSTNVTVGVATSITVTLTNAYTSDKVLIWVDWNNNNIFTDAGEAVFTSTAGTGPFTTTIIPPSGTTTGSKRMRIRLTDSSSGANLTPCGVSTYGEVEDYSLNVVAASYCAAGTTNTAFEYISNVTMGTINNTSTGSSYSNYSAQSTSMVIGTGRPITVSIGSGYTSDRVVIFCDWNNNGSFSDAGETVFSSATGVGPHSTTITPPVGAAVGTIRMRIRLTDTGAGPNETACGNSTYGEVEDYSLVVGTSKTGDPNLEDFPEAEQGPSTSPVRNTAALSIYPNPNAGTFNVVASDPGTYYLLDEMGKLIQSITLNAENNYTVSISNLAAGVYVLSGQNKVGITKQKIVVAH